MKQFFVHQETLDKLQNEIASDGFTFFKVGKFTYLFRISREKHFGFVKSKYVVRRVYNKGKMSKEVEAQFIIVKNDFIEEDIEELKHSLLQELDKALKYN